MTETMDKLIKAICQESEKEQSLGSTITQEGVKFIVPEHMQIRDAISTLQQWDKSQNSPSVKEIVITGHKAVLVYGLFEGLRGMFGSVIGNSKTVMSFFGPMTKPSQSVSIEVGYGETLTLPYGDIKIAGLPVEVTYSIDSIENGGETNLQDKMRISLSYLRKLQPLVDKMEKAIRSEIRNNPIFKGKAINSHYEFLNLNGFDLNKIVYTEDEQRILSANIFRVIKSSAEAKKLGISLKRTILLTGRFGTGKTLTALLTANIASANGWTFYQVLPGDSISNAFEHAKQYQPCVVFFEDIDAAVNSDRDRDETINEVLNTLDGMLSKSAQVITVLTTNHQDRIEKAMLRPGRIDKVISMGSVTPESLERLIRAYVGSRLHGPIDGQELMEHARDYTPSFVTEACQQALLYSLDRTNGKINGQMVTQDDIRAALIGLRPQYELMIAERQEQQPTIDNAIRAAVKHVMNEATETILDTEAEGMHVITPDAYKRIKEHTKQHTAPRS